MNVEQQANSEAIYGIAPMLKSERTMGFWDITFITGIYALAPWCFTQGGYIASLLGIKAAITNIIGVIIVFSLLYLLTVVIPTRHGIDIWIYQRATFGYKGLTVLWFIVIGTTWGWEAILARIYASSVAGLITSFTGAPVSESIIPWLGATCILLGGFLAILGPDVVRKISYVAVPGVLFVCAVILFVVFSNYSIADLVALKPTASSGDFRSDYMLATEWNLAFVCAWYAVLGVLPRMVKTERKSYWGFMTGFGLIYALIVCVGAFGAIGLSGILGVTNPDPAAWLLGIGGWVGPLSLLLLALSNISIMAVAMYSLSVSTKVINPEWNYRKIVGVWTVWCLILNFWGAIWTYYPMFLAVIGFIGGPAVIIILADFFIVRKQKLSMSSMYHQTEKNAYYYTGGFNLIGIASLIGGAIAYFAVYDPINLVARNMLFNITTGTGLSCIVAGLIYILVGSTKPGKAYLLRDR